MSRGYMITVHTSHMIFSKYLIEIDTLQSAVIKVYPRDCYVNIKDGKHFDLLNVYVNLIYRYYPYQDFQPGYTTAVGVLINNSPLLQFR